MRIGELADLVGVSTRTIRHYHHVGVLPAAARAANGYREYGPADAVRLVRVRRLTELGLSLEEVADVLAGDRDRDLDEVLAEVEADLIRREADLRAQRERVAALRARLTGRGSPSGGPAEAPGRADPAWADGSADRSVDLAVPETVPGALPVPEALPVPGALAVPEALADPGLVDYLAAVRAAGASGPALDRDADLLSLIGGPDGAELGAMLSGLAAGPDGADAAADVYRRFDALAAGPSPDAREIGDLAGRILAAVPPDLVDRARGGLRTLSPGHRALLTDGLGPAQRRVVDEVLRRLTGKPEAATPGTETPAAGPTTAGPTTAGPTTAGPTWTGSAGAGPSTAQPSGAAAPPARSAKGGPLPARSAKGGTLPARSWGAKTSPPPPAKAGPAPAETPGSG